MSKQLVTSLEAEYLRLQREVQRLEKEYHIKSSALERVRAALIQDKKLRTIRDRKATQSSVENPIIPE